MTRTRPWLQPSTCPHCGAVTLVGTRDVLADVTVDLELDPTILNPWQHAEAVAAGRPCWRVGVEAGRWWAGTAHWAAADRRLGGPDVVVPRHVCGVRLSGSTLTLDHLSTAAVVQGWLVG